MIIENLGNLTMRVNGPDYDEYAFTDFSLSSVPYDGTISVHFVTKINFDLTAELLDNKSPYAIIIHNTGEDVTTRIPDSFEVTVPNDGYYEITTLVFPTTDYVENVLGYLPGTLVTNNLHTNIIAADISNPNPKRVCFKILAHTFDNEENNHIWVGWRDIELSEILSMVEEAESFDVLNPNEISIFKHTQSAFVFDNLYACYISKAMDLLNKYTGDSGFCQDNSLCADNLNKYKTDIQVRDYLWMALNVIKYCIQNCQYLKALKILGCISSCSGICDNTLINVKSTKRSGGCGCNK